MGYNAPQGVRSRHCGPNSGDFCIEMLDAKVTALCSQRQKSREIFASDCTGGTPIFGVPPALSLLSLFHERDGSLSWDVIVKNICYRKYLAALRNSPIS